MHSSARMSFHPCLRVAAILTLSVAACAPLSSTAETRDATHFIAHREGFRSEPRGAKLAAGRLFGPTIDVSAVGDDRFAGYSGRDRIELHLDAGRIEGTVNNRPTSLSISSGANFQRLAGRFAGIRSALDVTPSAIRGNMGVCLYDLTRETPSSPYTGRACGSEHSDLTIPANLEAREPAERAMIVAVFLGRAQP